MNETKIETHTEPDQTVDLVELGAVSSDTKGGLGHSLVDGGGGYFL